MEVSSPTGYAVVRFKNGSVSEVPVIWLSKDRKTCWLPSTKNSTHYIYNNKQPNKKTWKRSPVVKIEGYFDTYEEARREASVIIYTTDESDGDIINIKQATKAQITKAIFSEEVKIPQLINEDTPVDFEEFTVIVPQTEAPCEKCCKTLEQIQKNMCEMKEMLTKISDKVSNLERASNLANEEKTEIDDMLPIQNKTDFDELEDYLSLPEKADFFKILLSQIGGNGYKDNVGRVLKRIFSNEFATNCSWLGHRGNFRLAGTKAMNIVKEIILKAHFVREKQVEQCCSEWIRHSRQRLKREKATS
ncbi:hypothetical protein Zmor_024185 [Zophobas morio]|uniref:DUF4806 domain-containing protein n=1 Tax=Zophobas morio TaxID=2755281 RepID=A0AA38I4L4_9CUCU|nr:hypothetical protein Zmor_024185 [Zophobas morio]